MSTGVPACAHCGSDAIPHRLTYITVAIDESLRPLFAPGPLTRFFTKLLHGIERRLTPLIFDGLKSIGLATYTDAPDDRTMLLAKVLWEEANVRGIKMQEIRLFNLPRNIFTAWLPSGKRIAFEGIPLTKGDDDRAWWMDNKSELKKRFRPLGIPVAAGGAAFSEEEALRIFHRLEAPAIVKPFTGSGSRHTLLHIGSDLDLVRAFHVAKKIAPLAVIEEELQGPVYRATVVDGKLVATLRRDPPHVLGDGVHTIEALVERMNEHPARNGPYFSKIGLDALGPQELLWQGLARTDVPEKGRRVTLHQKVNWSLGGTTADVTDEVHPDNRALFERVAAVIKSPVVGIDFIIADIGKPWSEQERCGVIECNSMPFFDNHHLPFEGTPRNVAGAIWDMAEAD